MLTLEVTAQNRFVLELLVMALCAVVAMIMEAPVPARTHPVPPTRRATRIADSHGD